MQKNLVSRMAPHSQVCSWCLLRVEILAGAVSSWTAPCGPPARVGSLLRVSQAKVVFLTSYYLASENLGMTSITHLHFTQRSSQSPVQIQTGCLYFTPLDRDWQYSGRVRGHGHNTLSTLGKIHTGHPLPIVAWLLLPGNFFLLGGGFHVSLLESGNFFLQHSQLWCQPRGNPKTHMTFITHNNE